ncbi:MAG: 3-hydroxyacyl-CoA dehydrogenase NAD-binding domain-containing protein [Candidatus Acidiferrum sp.]
MTGDSCKTSQAKGFVLSNEMEIKTIAIVGAADLGRRVAYATALAGFRTILEDISPSALEHGIAWIAWMLDENVSSGKVGAAARDAALANLSTVSSAEDASREADLIIETVSDELEMKLELFTIFDKFAKPGAIFASTTTSLSITELADVTFSPERCLGMRFIADAQHAERLELVKGRETSEETITACREVGCCMGREVFVISEEQTLSASNGA